MISLCSALLSALFYVIHIFNVLDRHVPLLVLVESTQPDTPFFDPLQRELVDQITDYISVVIWNWYLGYKKANAPNGDGCIVALDINSIKRFVSFSKVLIEICFTIFY